MKKIFLLLTVVAGTLFTSCSSDDRTVIQETTIREELNAEVFEIRDVNFAAPSYGIFYNLSPQIFEGDMILVYRLAGTDGGQDVWQMIPKTFYFDDGSELDYDFDFTRSNINIFMTGTFDLALEPGFTQNQLFRVVIIPGSLSNKKATPKGFSYENYQSVIDYYGIDDSKIGVLTPKL